jgi:DNA-binding protein Fis
MIDIEKFLVSLRSNKDLDGKLKPIYLADTVQEEIKIIQAAVENSRQMNLADGLDVEKFAELVRADEREACAKVVEDTLEPWLINEYIVKTTEAIRARSNDLQTAIERGTKAWADVPADWVEDLRGNTPDCKTHPDAPHGFDRNASHSADRYVCECEGWEPVDDVDISEECVHKSDKSIHEPVMLAVSPNQAAKMIGLNVATLEKDRRLGHLGIPFVQAGRRIVYRLVDLKNWLEEHKITPHKTVALY